MARVGEKRHLERMIERTILNTDGEAAFTADLTAVIPHMRAFARSLTNQASDAEDLAQEALLKAWKARGSFQPGTNLKGWVFMIVRNQFYSQKRRSRRVSALDPDVAARTLIAVDDATWSVELNDLRRALAGLPLEQREALILVGAGGVSYEEAALICGTPTGTIKSRVSRARTGLQRLLEEGDLPGDNAPAGDSMAAIMGELGRLQGTRAVAPGRVH